MDNSERVNKFGLVMLGLAGFGLAGDQRISGVNFGFTGGISLGGLGGSYSNGD